MQYSRRPKLNGRTLAGCSILLVTLFAGVIPNALAQPGADSSDADSSDVEEGDDESTTGTVEALDLAALIWDSKWLMLPIFSHRFWWVRCRSNVGFTSAGGR